MIPLGVSIPHRRDIIITTTRNSDFSTRVFWSCTSCSKRTNLTSHLSSPPASKIIKSHFVDMRPTTVLLAAIAAASGAVTSVSALPAGGSFSALTQFLGGSGSENHLIPSPVAGEAPTGVPMSIDDVLLDCEDAYGDLPIPGRNTALMHADVARSS